MKSLPWKFFSGQPLRNSPKIILKIIYDDGFGNKKSEIFLLTGRGSHYLPPQFHPYPVDGLKPQKNMSQLGSCLSQRGPERSKAKNIYLKSLKKKNLKHHAGENRPLRLLQLPSGNGPLNLLSEAFHIQLQPGPKRKPPMDASFVVRFDISRVWTFQRFHHLSKDFIRVRTLKTLLGKCAYMHQFSQPLPPPPPTWPP